MFLRKTTYPWQKYRYLHFNATEPAICQDILATLESWPLPRLRSKCIRSSTGTISGRWKTLGMVYLQFLMAVNHFKPGIVFWHFGVGK